MGDSVDRYDRRTFLGRGAATAAGLTVAVGAPTLLSGCGASTPTSAGSTSPGVSTATPRRGGAITVGVSSEIDGFLPALSHFDATGLTYANAVFDTLTKEAIDGSIRPHLASSVTPNPDRTRWTVTLRPGVVFHDGSPLDSDVVLQNYKALKSSPLTGQAVAPVTDVKTTGELTLEYFCDEPLVAFPAYLTTQVGYIIALSQLDSDDSQHPVGTGPFRYVSWEPNVSFTVARNPSYWQKGIPYLDTLTFKPIISDESRESALRSGTVDLMVSHDPGVIADLRHDPSYQQVTDLYTTVGVPDMDFICLNTTRAPLDDLTVRQALAHATNAPEIVRLFGRGVTTVNQSLFPPGSPYRAADNGYPTFDLAKAKTLVAQAKASHGGALALTLSDITDPRQAEIIQALQSMWEAAGFTVGLSQIQQVTYIDNLVEGNFQAAADEMFSAPDPDLNYVWLSPTTASGPIALNFARLKDPRMETALQQGRTHAAKEARVEAYQKVDRLLSEDLPYLWFSRAPWSMTANDTTMNFANPVLPDGTRGAGFAGGVFTPGQIWVRT
ncbi:MAG TPA: ABC transporter substrate-binding protein [Acidimicrobiales bacterium]|nr:ABC transporter substrate-binding protein [Acidimicrobiales bacterium]